MQKKIPTLCKIKRHIAIPSPSAIMFCKYGFRYRPEKLCKNCQLKVNPFSWGDVDVNS